MGRTRRKEPAIDRSIARTRERVPSRLILAGGVGGLVGGFVMGLFVMLQSAASGMGFWTPLEVCMASFVYRAEAQMMEHDMMMHPGMSMAEPLNATHLAVGAVLHMGFSVVVGVAFAGILFLLGRAGLSLLGTYGWYVAASIAGGAILYFLMMYLVLPWANPLMSNQTPRGPFFIGHLVFGLGFGLVVYPLSRRWADQPSAS
jgi:hypothetical protein